MKKILRNTGLTSLHHSILIINKDEHYYHVIRLLQGSLQAVFRCSPREDGGHLLPLWTVQLWGHVPGIQIPSHLNSKVIYFANQNKKVMCHSCYPLSTLDPVHIWINLHKFEVGKTCFNIIDKILGKIKIIIGALNHWYRSAGGFLLFFYQLNKLEVCFVGKFQLISVD